MKISFVIPLFNRAHTIERTLASLVRQPYSNKEVVIIDDGSTDNPFPIIDRYREQLSVLLHTFPANRGQNAARNVGMQLATGDIVTVLDSDDEDAGVSLDGVVTRFEQYPSIMGLFTGCTSKSSGLTLSQMPFGDLLMEERHFYDGTYEGEYQFFLRRSRIPEKMFREGLAVKRSCSMLTWYMLAQTHQFMIAPILTKLYTDTGSDRMGSVGRILAEADELRLCNQLILDEFGDRIKFFSRSLFNWYVGRLAFYSLIARGRGDALRALKRVCFDLSALNTVSSIGLCITIGASLTRKLRVLRG